MDAMNRIERALDMALAGAEQSGTPPKLSAAMRHAVFPGGARLRPRLAVAVAASCGEDKPVLTDAAAAAVEILHCASLVHDDLPCFDDADTRRGRPSVHRAYGEPIAVLAGDALIVAAFEALARAAFVAPMRLPTLSLIVARAVGTPDGMCAGQAWECEDKVPLSVYHRAKTGALFAAASMVGAAAAGQEPVHWRALGAKLGEAYQVADDIRDSAGSAELLGKPVGQDEILDRPSATRELGLGGAIRRLDLLVAEASASIPACPGRDQLRVLIEMEAKRFLPEGLAQTAA